MAAAAGAAAPFAAPAERAYRCAAAAIDAAATAVHATPAADDGLWQPQRRFAAELVPAVTTRCIGDDAAVRPFLLAQVAPAGLRLSLKGIFCRSDDQCQAKYRKKN